MSASRRELLTLMLGAPLAAQACDRGFLRRSYPGTIRGASHQVGHKLRGATVEASGQAASPLGVAIVGAGPSGLSAAWRLERLGYRDYRVFDLDAQVGGTSAFGTDGVVPYPWGAHYVPLPVGENPALVSMLDEMGVLEQTEPPEAHEQLLVREPEERLFIDDQWIAGVFPSRGASRSDLEQAARFQALVDDWVSWRDPRGRRAFTIPVSRCSDDAHVTSLDRISAAAWLDQNDLTSARLRWWVEYACRDDYGLTLKQCSAWAMLFYFCSRVPAPKVESAPFVAWPQGNGAIVQHLARVAGGRIQTGQLVTDVVPAAGHVDVAVLDARSGGLRKYRAQRVIVAVPKFIAARIIRPWRERPPQHLAPFSYGVWMVANLHLTRRPRSRGFELCWENVLYDSPSVGYVVATHQRFRDHGPTIFSYYQPYTEEPKQARERLLSLDHDTLARGVVADLARAHQGLEGAVERVDVWRWGHAMIRPTVGFTWGGARQRAQRAEGRMHFAHSDLSGMALFEEAQDQGVRAAEEVMKALGRPFDPLVVPLPAAG